MSILLNRMEVVIIILCCLHLASTAPVQDTVKRPGRVPRMQGCFYNAAHFENGEQIITNEPCLNCTCVDSTLMCYLRVCPFLKPVGEECIEEKSKGDCCPKIWCPEVVKEKDCDDPKHEGKHDHPGCYLDNKYYPDGAMLPHDPKKPCEVCYCIRNSTSCVIQECELKVDGCTPVYKEGQCCPCRYNCSYDESTTIAPPGVTVQDLSEGCVLSDGRFIEDGEAVNSTNPCEHCYCMRNEVVCAIQECQAPGDNCRPLAPKSGQCCPDRYECPSGGIISSSPAMTFSSVFSTDDITTPKTSVKGYGIKTSSQKGIGIKGGASKSSSLKPAGVKGVFSESHSSVKSSIPSSTTSSVSVDGSIDHNKESIPDAIEDATIYELEIGKTETSTSAFYETSSETPEVLVTKEQSYTTLTSSHSTTQEIHAESTSQQATKTENIFERETNINSKVTEPFEVTPHVHAETTVTNFEEEASKTPEKQVTEEISKVTTATSVASEENAEISSLGIKSTKLQGVKGGFKKEADSKEIGSKTVASINGQPLVKANDTYPEFPKFGVKSVGPENDRVKEGSQQSTSSYDKAGITKHTSTIDSLSLFVESSNAQFVQPSNAKNEGQLLLVASGDETAGGTIDAHSLPMGILTKGGNRSVVAQITGIFRPSIPLQTKSREQNKTEAPEMTENIKTVGVKSVPATGFGVKGHPIYPPRERPMLPIGAIPGEHKIPTSSKNRPTVVAIPGEGGCRVGKIMYRNGQPMPSFHSCKMNCQCINSVVYCDDVVCEIPADSQNCVRIKIPGECCPNYLCGSTSTESTQSASISESTTSSTEFGEDVTQEPKSTIAELTKDISLNEKFPPDNKQSITESILTTQSQTNLSSLNDTSESPKVLTTTTDHTLFTVPSKPFTEEKTEEQKSTMSPEEEILLKETHASDYEILITENGLITHSQTDQSIFSAISKSSEGESVLDTSSTTPPTPYTNEKGDAKSTVSEFTEGDISQKKMQTPDHDTSITESSLTTQSQTDQNNLSDISLSTQVQPIIVRDPSITTQPTLNTEEGTENLKSTVSESTEEILQKQTHSPDYESLVTESILTNQSQTDQSSLSDISISSEAELTTIYKTFTTPSTLLTEENTYGPKSTIVEFDKEEILFEEKQTSDHEAPVTENILASQSQTDQSSISDTSLPSKIKSTTEDSVTVSSLQITKRADSNEAEMQTTLAGSTSDNSKETYSESTKEFSSQTTSLPKKEIITEKNASSEIDEMVDMPTSTSFAEQFHDVTTHETLTSLKVKESVSDKIITDSDYLSPTATSKSEETTDVPKKQEDAIQLLITSALPFSSDKDLFHSETTTASLMSQTSTIQSSADFTDHEIATAEDQFSSIQASDSLQETTILLEEITETNPSNNLTTLKTYTDIITTNEKEKEFPELSTHSATDLTTKLLEEVSTFAQKTDYTGTDTSHAEEILHKNTVYPKEPEHVHSFTILVSDGIEKTTNEITDATKRDFLEKTTTKHFPLHEITTEGEGSTYETKYNKLSTPFYSTTISKITKEYANTEEFTHVTSSASEATEFHPIITTKFSEIKDKSAPSISTLLNEEHVSKTTVIPVSIKSTVDETSEITENDSSHFPASDIPSEIMHEHFTTIIGSEDNNSTFINETERDSTSSGVSRETQPSFIPSSITELSKQLLSQTARPFSETVTAKYSEITDHYSENAEFPKETTISSGEVFESLNNLETATEKNPGELETSKSVTPSISTEIFQEKSTFPFITQTSTQSSDSVDSEATNLYSDKTASSEEITVPSEFSEITSSGEDSKYSTPSSFYEESTIKDEIQITSKTAQSTSTSPDKIQTDETTYKDVKSSTAYDSSSTGSLYENDHSSTITYTEESSSLSQNVESEEEMHINLTTTLLLEHPTTSHAYSSSTENDKIFKEKTPELSEHSKTTVSTFHEKAETPRPFQKLNTDLPEKSHGISIADPNQSSYLTPSNEKNKLDSTGLILTSENNEINETLKQENSTDSTEQEVLKAMILELDKELNNIFNPEKQREVTGSSVSESAFDLATGVSTVGNNEMTKTSTENAHTTFHGIIKTDTLETEKTEFPPTTMSVSFSNTFYETSTPHDTVIQTETVPMVSIKGPENLVLHTESKKPVTSPTTETYLTTLNKITNVTVINDHDSDSSKYTTSLFEIKTTSPDPSTLKFTESIESEIVFIDPITKTPPQLESTTKTEATAETSKLSDAEIEITKTTLVSSESENAGKTVSYTEDSNLKETESPVVEVITHNHLDTAITVKDSYTAEENTQTPNIVQILGEVSTPSTRVSFFDSTPGSIVSDVNISFGSSTVENDFGSSNTEEYTSEHSESNQHTKTHSGSQEPTTSLKTIFSEETAPTAGSNKLETETNDFVKTFTLNTSYLETKSTPIENDEEAATHPIQVQVTFDDLSYNDSHVDQFTIKYDIFDSTQVSINEDAYTTHKKTEDTVSEVTEESVDKWIEVEKSTQDAEISSTKSPENFNSVTTDKSKTNYDTPLSIAENTKSSQIFDSTHISFVTEISEITTQHSESGMAGEVTQPEIEESSSDFMIGAEGVVHSSNTKISYATSTYNETSELFEFLQNETQTTVVETTERSTDLPVTFIKDAYNVSTDIGKSSSNDSVIPTEKTDTSPLYTPTETTGTKKASSTAIVFETETDQTTISNLSEKSSVSTFNPIQTQKDNASLFAEITTTREHDATNTEIPDVTPTESIVIVDVSETTSVSMSLPFLLTTKKEDQSTVSDNAVNTVSSESASNEIFETQSNEIENDLLTKTTENLLSTPKIQNMFEASVFEETSHKFETTQNIKLSTAFEKDTESKTYFPTEMEENVLLVSLPQSDTKVSDTSTEKITTVTEPDIILSSVNNFSEIISATSNQSKDHESYIPTSKTTVQVLETSQAVSNKENPSTFIIPDSTVTADAESIFAENSTNFPIENFEQAFSEVVSTTLRTQHETTKYPSESLHKTIVTDILPANTDTQTSGDLEHIQTLTTTKNVDIEDINSIYGSITSNVISETAETSETSESTVSETKESSVELSTKGEETTSHSVKTDDYTSSVTEIPVLEHNISQSLAMQDIKKVETDITSTDLSNEPTLGLFSSTQKSQETAITDHSQNENKDIESETAALADGLLAQTMENTDSNKIILSTSMIPGTITEVFQSTKIGITEEIFDAATSTIPTDLKHESAVSSVMENTMEEDKSSDITDTENKTTTLTLEQTKDGNELDLPHDSTIIVESEISGDASPTLAVEESEILQVGIFTTESALEASTETTVVGKITTFNGYNKSQTISSLEELLLETTATMSTQVLTDKLTYHVTNTTPKVTEIPSTHFTRENASGSTKLDTLSETLSISDSVSIKETQIKTKTFTTKASSEVTETSPYYTTKVNHITKELEIVTPDNEGEDSTFDRLSTSLISKETDSSHLPSTATNEYGSTETGVVTETSEISKNKTSVMFEFVTKTMENITHPSRTQNSSIPLTTEVTSEATQKEMSTAESDTEIHDINSKHQTEDTEKLDRRYTSTTTEILSEENQNHSGSIDTSIQYETVRWPTTLTTQKIKTVPTSLNIEHEETARDKIVVTPEPTTVFSTYFPSHLTEFSSVSQDAGNEFTSLITESSINEIASIIDLKSQSTVTQDKDLIVETTLSPLQFVITQNVTSDIDITTKASQTTQKANVDDVTDSKVQYTTSSVISDLIDSSSLNRTIHDSHVPETLLMTQEITDTSTIKRFESDSMSTAKVTSDIDITTKASQTTQKVSVDDVTDSKVQYTTSSVISDLIDSSSLNRTIHEPHVPETLLMTQEITDTSTIEGFEADSMSTAKFTSDIDITTKASQTTQKANVDDVTDSKTQYTTSSVISDLIDSSSLNRTIHEPHVPETLLMTQEITDTSTIEGFEADSMSTAKFTSDIDITTKASQTTQKANVDDVTDSKAQYTTSSVISDLIDSSSLNRTIHEPHVPETVLMTQKITDTSTIEGFESDSMSTAKVTQSSTFSETSAVTTEMLMNLTEQSFIASTLKSGDDIFITDILRLTTEIEENKSTEDSYRYSETPSTTSQIETTENTSYFTGDKEPVSTDFTSTKFIQSENTLKEAEDENALLTGEISSISDKSTTILTDMKNSTETAEIIHSTKIDTITENYLTETASTQTTNVAAHSVSTQNASIHIVSEITSSPFDSTQSVTTEHKIGFDDESVTNVEIFTSSPTTKIIEPNDANSKGTSVIHTENYDSSSSDAILSTTLHSFSDNIFSTKYVDTDTSTIISHTEAKEPTSIPIHQEFSTSDATVKPLHSSQITHFDSKNVSETDMFFTISSTEAVKEIIDSSTLYTVHSSETKTPSDILITNSPDDLSESISWSENPKTTFTESVTERPKETEEYLHDGSVLPEKETEVSPTVLPPTIIESSAFFRPQHERITTLEATETTEASYASSAIEHKHEFTEREFTTEKTSTTDYYPSIQDQSDTSEIDSKSSMLTTTRESTLNETYTSLGNDTSIEFPIYSEAGVFEATEQSTKSPTENESYTSETIDKSTETKTEEILNAHDIVLTNSTMSEYLSNFTISAFTESDNNQKELFTETSQSIKETSDTFSTKSDEVTFKPSDITFKYVTTTARLFTSEIKDFTYENKNSVSDDTEEAKTVTDVSELETHATEINVASFDNLSSVSLENNQSQNEYGSNDVFDIPIEVHNNTHKINTTLTVEEDKRYNISTPNILASTSDLFEKTTSELFAEEEFTKGSINHELHDKSKDQTVTETSTKIFDTGESVTTEHENYSKISIDAVHDTFITSDESETSIQVGSKFSTMVSLPPTKSTTEDSEILSSKVTDEVSVSESTIHDYLTTTTHSYPDSILTLKLTTPPPQLSTLLDNKFDSLHLKKNETQNIEITSPENILFNSTTKYDEKKFNASTKLSPAQQGYLRPIPGEDVIPASTTLSTQHVDLSPIPGEGVVLDTTHKDFVDELDSSNETTYTISQTTIHIPIGNFHESEDALSNIKQTFFPLRNNTVLKVPDAAHQFVLGDSRPLTSTNTDIVQRVESKYPGESSPSPGWVAHPLHEDLVKKLSTVFPSSPATIVQEIHNLHSSTVSGESFTQSQEDDGVCYFEGGVYLSSEQIPRTDTCEFCFCFKGDIICLQQTCPPPIKGCYAIPIEGFCCPRFHCPVKQTWFNVSAATTTTTIVPFGHVSHKTHSTTPGCQIEGKSYLLHQVVQASSNPCMLCRCDYGGIMKCDPRSCKPDAPMIEEIAEAYSRKRR